MKIYWASKHQPLLVQLEWLKNKFGNIEVIKGRNDNAQKIVADFREKNCDEMVIVAPLWVIYHVLQEGIKPLWADMELVEDPDEANLEYRGRLYKFNNFKRIIAIEIKKEEIKKN